MTVNSQREKAKEKIVKLTDVTRDRGASEASQLSIGPLGR